MTRFFLLVFSDPKRLMVRPKGDIHRWEVFSLRTLCQSGPAEAKQATILFDSV